MLIAKLTRNNDRHLWVGEKAMRVSTTFIFIAGNFTLIFGVIENDPFVYGCGAGAITTGIFLWIFDYLDQKSIKRKTQSHD